MLGQQDVKIGGPEAADGNLISGNAIRGIHVWNDDRIQLIGNRIGTDAAGTAAIPNGLAGVYVEGSHDVELQWNVIAFNTGNGVTITTSQGTDNHSQRARVTQNSIHSNGALGIDIAADIGVSPNDAGDADGGPNAGQNFPIIDSVSLSGSLMTIKYSVPTAPANATYPLRVEIFSGDSDPNAPEGKTFLGADTFTAADFVNGFKTATFVAQGAVGARIVATATDANGNTSEFSAGAGLSRFTINLP